MARPRQTDKAVVMPILSPILGEELALAVIEHRDSLGYPLTARAAQTQVKEYIKSGNPEEAADMQILRGWRAIFASWFLNEKAKDQRQSQQQNQRGLVNAAMDLRARRQNIRSDYRDDFGNAGVTELPLERGLIRPH